MDELVIALTTLPADVDASGLARALVEARVAACVTVLPAVRSLYRWEGAIHEDAEQQLVIKTTRARVDDLWTALRARHPHDVPEFLVVPVLDGNPAYVAWVVEQVAIRD